MYSVACICRHVSDKTYLQHLLVGPNLKTTVKQVSYLVLV